MIILVEADGFGFLEQQTGGNPRRMRRWPRPALPELAGLPNTVAGWGLAFLQLRQAVGATNAILGDGHLRLGDRQGSALLQRHRCARGRKWTRPMRFLAPLGLAPNQTGADMGSAGRTIRSIVTRTITPTHRTESLVGCERLSVDRIAKLQPLRRMAAAVERQRRRNAGCCGRSRSGTRTT